MATTDDVYRAHPTEAEIADVLADRGAAALGTLNADGSVHLTYVLFLFEDDRFLVETASSTRKARNVAARPSASILVQGRATTGRSVMVSAECEARVIAADEARTVNHRLRAKYLAADAIEAVDRVWDAFDDIAIELRPVRWRTWTGAELQAATEAGTGRPYEELWLPD
jgi:PPOX class probable F420-dependent enzyme